MENHRKMVIYIENHHVLWVNQLEMAIFNSYFDITRGYSYFCCMLFPLWNYKHLIWGSIMGILNLGKKSNNYFPSMKVACIVISYYPDDVPTMNWLLILFPNNFPISPISNWCSHSFPIAVLVSPLGYLSRFFTMGNITRIRKPFFFGFL